jgi:hypothetical protein
VATACCRACRVRGPRMTSRVTTASLDARRSDSGPGAGRRGAVPAGVLSATLRRRVPPSALIGMRWRGRRRPSAAVRQAHRCASPRGRRLRRPPRPWPTPSPRPSGTPRAAVRTSRSTPSAAPRPVRLGPCRCAPGDGTSRSGSSHLPPGGRSCRWTGSSPSSSRSSAVTAWPRTGIRTCSRLVASGRLRPQDLVTREIPLDEAGEALRDVGREPGITVVTHF